MRRPRRQATPRQPHRGSTPNREPAPRRRPTRTRAAGALDTWLLNHARALLFSLGKLYRNASSSAMTVAVIGIALALPSGLYVMLQNLHSVVGGLDQGVQISLFLKRSVDNDALHSLSLKLDTWPEITRTQAVTPAQGLAEFRKYSGFGNTLDALGSNPLPPVIVVYPKLQGGDSAQIGALQKRLQQLPEVDEARLDLAWVQRLYAIVDIAQRAVGVIGGMLGITVLLVVGNTIRLDILNRRREIEVAKLIGATDAFIRRPFLYGGFWLGLFGGILALLLVGMASALLAGPVQHLSALYASSFTLNGLDAVSSLRLLGLSVLLGLGGSWIAVGRHLRDIEPS
ncbi:MAG: permease-like cell division protein FtsX [Acidihalobacter sp.]|jgi:cell division transport system permease protein|uniref:permease-like cell division protein FtsX n=1 Tax=Acidihalobacter sp. TaxID=1872108 RepID=UPI00307E42F6